MTVTFTDEGSSAEVTGDATSGAVRVAAHVQNSAVAKLRADLEKRQDMPTGTVVTFVSNGNNGERYLYAALYVKNQWWLTGAGTFYEKKMSHHDFTGLLRSDAHRISDLKVAVEFESIEGL